MSGFVVFEHEGELVVDSRLVALELGIDHQAALMETIDRYKSVLQYYYGRFRFQTEQLSNSGKNHSQKFCYLNEKQATFLMALSSDPKQSEMELSQAFSKAKEMLKFK